MAQIVKKILTEHFDLVANGKKRYELRLGDFIANEGDELVLQEWDSKSGSYTGRAVTKKINFVRKFSLEELYQFWPKKEIEQYGIQILQLD
ncbi:MAG: hypothetical protein A2845_01480 [Candidatus Lloydbacteria bacterium RIFCSPHIGHO2_01_FULL_49_22]|uniref:DUF3850 domain-containing protein n=1 Tax=Candidatus Lloydbacteria bacterium RIFCSPHIGHO2_01_FULL_49_22 TaxID=1798658 RepID=A0A1G2CZZ4_9BACT|nr:MAG: hypothetical protein A2845_01480 [Candidatus Lloydbacteria bacterium RIFCSPHIGHO2_01_FULL_49_22]OGZ09969.1 MAG: hypothetical protein A3C14_04645 [Candidatus Lloydbacteria bacterium RIFCSPHIGHO2_02_FULL_50_18]